MPEIPSRAIQIIDTLKKSFPLELKDFASSWIASLGEGLFAVLVVTILSQNTTDIAALKAYDNLKKTIGIEPKNIARAPLSKIEQAIQIAGLYRNKSRGLKALSKQLVKLGQSYLSEITNLSWEEAREELQRLPQIGPKTADVFLAIVRKAPVLPVDTHVARVSRRLGLVPQEGGYETIRRELERVVPSELRHEAHMLLITLGRRICKARVPLCFICSVEHLCLYPNKTRRPDWQKHYRALKDSVQAT